MSRDVEVGQLVAGTRDGCILRSRAYQPKFPRRPFDVLLARTPYGYASGLGTSPMLDPFQAAERGYAVVLQDVRGRWSSDGDDFDPYVHEREDGYDAASWAAQLPGASGRVGMFGVSYVGATALNAAMARPSGLAAIALAQFPQRFPLDVMFRGGARQLGRHVYWSLAHIAPHDLTRRILDEARRAEIIGSIVELLDNYEAAMRDLTWVRSLGRSLELPYVEDALAYDFAESVARSESSVSEEACDLPSLVIAGWHDYYLDSNLKFFSDASRDGRSPQTREGTQLIVGPWAHGQFSHVIGQHDFGLRANANSLDLTGALTSTVLDWFDARMHESPSGDTPPVRLFVQGANRWRDEDAWPLRRTRIEEWYLRDGRHLSRQPPDYDSVSSYVFDPTSPCPTTGGALLLPGQYARGPADQRALIGRPDTLQYVSPCLEFDYEVCGSVSMVLYAATSAVDTDWVMKLCDVHPNGRVLSVTDGVLRARYRSGDLGRSEPVQPGRVVEYEISFSPTAMVFRRGHRMSLLISSSDFPRYDVNPGTGGLSPTQKHCIAKQDIHSCPSHRSRIRVSVNP